MNQVEEHLSTADFVAGGKAAREQDQPAAPAFGQEPAREEDSRPTMTGGQAAALYSQPGWVAAIIAVGVAIAGAGLFVLRTGRRRTTGN